MTDMRYNADEQLLLWSVVVLLVIGSVALFCAYLLVCGLKKGFTALPGYYGSRVYSRLSNPLRYWFTIFFTLGLFFSFFV
jgi:hypothetical protein